MTIYVDLVFLINFIMDFYILSGVKFLLKLDTKIIRILIGSFVGSISLFLLFFHLSNTILNLFKIVLSLLMVLFSFGRYKFFNKLFYLYLISIFLGGSLYLINDTLGYEVNGMVFISNGYSINLLVLIIISPLIIYFYVKEYLVMKKKINTAYNVKVKVSKKEITLEGFLDTGNKLIDPYFHRPIILVNKKYIDLRGLKILYVPFESLNNNGILKCIIPEYIYIDNKLYKEVIVGISENLDNDCILNERLFDL